MNRAVIRATLIAIAALASCSTTGAPTRRQASQVVIGVLGNGDADSTVRYMQRAFTGARFANVRVETRLAGGDARRAPALAAVGGLSCTRGACGQHKGRLRSPL
jgi:hypothetical protein